MGLREVCWQKPATRYCPPHPSSAANKYSSQTHVYITVLRLERRDCKAVGLEKVEGSPESTMALGPSLLWDT